MQSKKEETAKTNYSFLLKCMASIAAAALVTAGVFAIIAATKASAAGIAASTVIAASAAIAGPLGAISAILGAALLVGIAITCLSLCSGRTTYTSRPYGTTYGFCTPPVIFPQTISSPVHVHSGGFFGGGTTHQHHSGGFGGQTHGHSGGFGGGATTHSHAGGVGGGSSSHSHGHR